MKKKIVLKYVYMAVVILLLTNCVCVHAGMAEIGDISNISDSNTVSPTVVTDTQLGLGLQSQTTYYIMNAATGGLLSPRTLSDVSGMEVGVRGTRAEQMKYQWIISDPQSLASRIIYANSASGKVLSATTSGVTLESSGSSGSQRFSISRVQDGDYKGLYLIKSGGYYLTRVSTGSYSLHMIAVPNQYSYWSFMEADKGYADIYSFTYTEEDGTSYDSSANDDLFVNYMDAFGFVGFSNNNETAQTAYDYMTLDEDVFVFRGHANPNYLPFMNDVGEVTDAIKADSSYTASNRYYLDDSNENALAKQRVMMFLGCKTGLSDASNYNLVDEAFSKGAHFVLGTTASVDKTDSNQFLEEFIKSAADGENIKQCINDAILAAGINYSWYPETNGKYPVYYVGDICQYLVFESVTID